VRTVFRLTMIFILFLFTSYADIYKYTDDSGSVCITNSLQNVPKKFRSSLFVVKEDVPVQKKLLPEVQKVTTDPAPPVQSFMPQNEPQNQAFPIKPDNRRRNINTALVISGLTAVYFILGKVTDCIGFRRVGTVMFLTIVLPVEFIFMACIFRK
jgi:hypothetical protein